MTEDQTIEILDVLKKIYASLERIAEEQQNQKAKTKTKKRSIPYEYVSACPVITKDKNWKEKLNAWLSENVNPKKGLNTKLTTDEVLVWVFNIDPKNAKQQARRTLGAELRAQGYIHKQNFREGIKGYFWTKNKISENVQRRDEILKKLYDNSTYVPPQANRNNQQANSAPQPDEHDQHDQHDQEPNKKQSSESLYPSAKNWVETNPVAASKGFVEYDILNAIGLPMQAARDLAELLPSFGCRKVFLDGKQGGPTAGKTGFFWTKKLPEVEELI